MTDPSMASSCDHARCARLPGCSSRVLCGELGVCSPMLTECIIYSTVFVCLVVCLFIYLFVCLFVCACVRACVRACVCVVAYIA